MFVQEISGETASTTPARLSINLMATAVCFKHAPCGRPSGKRPRGRLRADGREAAALLRLTRRGSSPYANSQVEPHGNGTYRRLALTGLFGRSRDEFRPHDCYPPDDRTERVRRVVTVSCELYVRVLAQSAGMWSAVKSLPPAVQAGRYLVVPGVDALLHGRAVRRSW